MSWKLVQLIVTLIGLFSIFLGLPGTIDDVDVWKNWVQQSTQLIDVTPLNAGFMIIGIALVVGINAHRPIKRSIVFLMKQSGTALGNVPRVPPFLVRSPKLKLEILGARFLQRRDLPYPGLDNLRLNAEVLEITMNFRLSLIMQVERVELHFNNDQIRATNDPVQYLQDRETYSFAFVSSRFDDSLKKATDEATIWMRAGGEEWRSNRFSLPAFTIAQPTVKSASARAEQPTTIGYLMTFRAEGETLRAQLSSGFQMIEQSPMDKKELLAAWDAEGF